MDKKNNTIEYLKSFYIKDYLYMAFAIVIYSIGLTGFIMPNKVVTGGLAGAALLIKYATANLEKADVLRIVRSLAIFRPSLIALQMPLTEDDEVFVERSIQRTILEFEKLISFSGTPTVVWRRTCEIVVVGNEFSMLSQWSKDYLMGRYIYEFFDKPSILEYWEKFALHAFENTAQSIMMPVTLKTSTGQTTKCAACFSIKRDIFDLPSLIVGNFLPILS